MSDIYVVVHIATTCDDNNNYISRDSTEIIELSWAIVDACTLQINHTENVHIKPINTPLTPSCSQITKVTWDDVKSAGGFKDAISQFDKYVQTNLLNENKDFSFVTMDISKLRVQLPREARDKGVVLPPYLQHPRIFDLQNEYCKWQTTHPEALSYTSNSLMNIITALEVDINRSSLVSPLSTASTTSPPLVPAAGSGTAAAPSSSTLPLTAQSSIMSEDLSKSVTASSNNEETAAATMASDTKPESNPTELAESRSEPESETKDKPDLMVTIYAKLLIQLIKKSLPVEEHHNVLTKPYDSSQDVKLFLAERSKILYLSNLPCDTTQSELESWFTQLGARPIAFWTLKNLETNNNSTSTNSTNNTNPNSNPSKNKSKGISGFAVFGTHEEATESLSMNGRALNDRPIEIQPSSTRVLDKASDLLTPFPPSKNRPRPGDWTCPSCGFSNFQRRTACFRCSFPATSAVAFQEQIHPNNMGINRRNNNTNSNNNVINFNNNSPTSSVDKLPLNGSGMNGYSNYGGQMYNDNNGHGHGGVSMGGNNGNNNHNGSRNYGGNGGNLVPFRAGDWKCTNEACQYHNFAKNLVCLKCGINKPVNLHNPNQMNNKVNQMNSVSSTAAAIAAATASGQPLNFNSPYGQASQSQSRLQHQQHQHHQHQHHQHQHHQHQHQHQHHQQHQQAFKAPQLNSQTYNPVNLYHNDLSRTSSNGTPIQNSVSNINVPNSHLLTQQYLMMQGQPPLLETGGQRGSPAINPINPSPTAAASTINPQPIQPGAQSLNQTQSISHPSTGNRDTFSQSGTASTTSPGLYQAFGYPQYQTSGSANVTPTTNANDPSLNFNSISSQFSSLNLNNP